MAVAGPSEAPPANSNGDLGTVFLQVWAVWVHLQLVWIIEQLNLQLLHR